MRRYKAVLQEDGRLNDTQIVKLIKAREQEIPDLLSLHNYYRGKNPAILAKDVTEHRNRIPVPYGRLLVRIVVGFMYKSGLISYGLDEDTGETSYYSLIEDVFKANREAELNTELGKDQTIFGEAYELHYVDNEEGEDQFAKVPVYEFIPVYNYDIKPKLIAGIRFYAEHEGQSKKIFVEIYYTDRVERYQMVGSSLTLGSVDTHPYGQVPVVIYRNNEDIQGDLEHIQKLIDAYDVLISTFLDDEEKFAEAILLLYGKYLDEEALSKLQKLRVIDGLKENDKLEYLTKDLSVSGRKELLEIIRQEIHRQSLIPDMTDPSALGQKSGEAFTYLFALFEMLAGEKQSYFAQGLRKRIELITATLSYPKGKQVGDPSDIKIIFTRNIPKNLTAITEMVSKLWGMVSERSLLEQLPFIENPDAEVEQKRKEDAANIQERPLSSDEVLKVYQDGGKKSAPAGQKRA
jgi:SPP1 family phage portal protein